MSGDNRKQRVNYEVGKTRHVRSQESATRLLHATPLQSKLPSPPPHKKKGNRAKEKLWYIKGFFIAGKLGDAYYWTSRKFLSRTWSLRMESRIEYMACCRHTRFLRISQHSGLGINQRASAITKFPIKSWNGGCKARKTWAVSFSSRIRASAKEQMR